MIPQTVNPHVKLREVAVKEIDEIMKYLDVSDKKQIGANHVLLKGTNKYDLHEVLLSIVEKFKSIESEIEKINERKSNQKKAGRPKKLAGQDKSSKESPSELEGKVQG